VILELGSSSGAWAALALPKSGVEEPSDIKDLGYIALAESDWSFKLGAELAAARFDVDLNRVS
jgi:hypothetical protein